jgi:alcohol dehydrogenase
LPVEEVYFGPNSIKYLSAELDRKDSKKPFVITGHSIATNTDLLQKVEKAASRKLAGVFSGIKQHAPSTTVMAAVREVSRSEADCLISLGGGSPIDSTKIIVKELSKDYLENPIPHFAVPTTLSAAEFSHVAGMTDEKANRKTGFRDKRMIPQVVFLDPEMTQDTPKWLWASTGIRSLDHAIEAVYSPKHQLYTDTLALQAISLLFEHLKESTEKPDDVKSRLACQIAAWMSFAGVFNVGTGLSHAIGRVIGATWNIPHGITSCLILPEVMREEAKRNPDRLAIIARAEGQKVDAMTVEEAALSAAEGVRSLVLELGLFKKLSEYGITRSDLPRIAREAAPEGQNNVVVKILERIL